jgi:hypothetical protein
VQSSHAALVACVCLLRSGRPGVWLAGEHSRPRFVWGAFRGQNVAHLRANFLGLLNLQAFNESGEAPALRHLYSALLSNCGRGRCLPGARHSQLLLRDLALAPGTHAMTEGVCELVRVAVSLLCLRHLAASGCAPPPSHRIASCAVLCCFCFEQMNHLWATSPQLARSSRGPRCVPGTAAGWWQAITCGQLRRCWSLCTGLGLCVRAKQSSAPQPPPR